MSAKIIVSYDGTANEQDALALGGLFARAGAEVAIAYVRHNPEPDSEREAIAQREAQELLEAAAERLGVPSAGTYVVTDRSTPQGLSALAQQIGANAVVFCSDSHTARGHITIGNSAERLLENGPVAVAIAPVGLAAADRHVQRVVAVGEAGGDGSAQRTAKSLASAFGADVAPVADQTADLLVIDSRAEAEHGRTALSTSAVRLIEIATCPVLVLPRGEALEFGGAPAAALSA